MNATTSALNSIGTVSSQTGWGVTVSIFLVIFTTIFWLSKNFRQFIYGAVISGILLINYKFSRWVGVSTVENNFKPLESTLFVIGFILSSIIIGKVLLKLKSFKKLEKKILGK